MPIVERKPRTPSLRMQRFIVNKEIDYKKEPERSLLAPLKRSGGRNAYGRITTRHRGGGAKRQYRMVDFCRKHRDVPGKVTALEYDPNRNVELALIVYANGAKTYVIRPEGLIKGSVIMASESAEVVVGNSLPLRSIPVGFNVHNVELYPGRGGQIAKAAGSYVQLVSKEGGVAMLRMPSSEIRLVSLDCWATVGSVANADFINLTLGKAGRSRHRGIRPTVRGIAMNPVDHPRGGGEGRSKSGTGPISPWGKNCNGVKTRRRKSSLIVKRRVKKSRKR